MTQTHKWPSYPQPVTARCVVNRTLNKNLKWWAMAKPSISMQMTKFCAHPTQKERHMCNGSDGRGQGAGTLRIACAQLSVRSTTTSNKQQQQQQQQQQQATTTTSNKQHLTAQLPDTSSTVWLNRPLMVPLRRSMPSVMFCLYNHTQRKWKGPLPQLCAWRGDGSQAHPSCSGECEGQQGIAWASPNPQLCTHQNVKNTRAFTTRSLLRAPRPRNSVDRAW